MRYYIQYPLVPSCNLRCYYCFHGDEYMSNSLRKITFTIDDYIRWRDACLTDAEEIWVEMLGGETFLPATFNFIEVFLDATKVEKIELQTNGTLPRANYERLVGWAHRVKVIGFTYHRKMIDGIPALRERFIGNVRFLRDRGIKVYVKELSFPEELKGILLNKVFWKNEGVDFRIQPYAGAFRGISAEKPEQYPLFRDMYYVECGDPVLCSCRDVHKGLCINPDGTIVACIRYPGVVGNIKKLEYTKGYRVNRLLGRTEYARRK